MLIALGRSCLSVYLTHYLSLHLHFDFEVQVATESIFTLCCTAFGNSLQLVSILSRKQETTALIFSEELQEAVTHEAWLCSYMLSVAERGGLKL